MGQIKKPKKIFMSYSHRDDEKYQIIEKFTSFMSILIKNKDVELWHDGKIEAGQKILDEIDPELKNSEIVCLFISSNYLSSASCEKEKKMALELKNQNSVKVIPIIISPCPWQEDGDISSIKALPKDGKPLSIYTNIDEGWNEIIEGLIPIIKKSKNKKENNNFDFSLNLNNAKVINGSFSTYIYREKHYNDVTVRFPFKFISKPIIISNLISQIPYPFSLREISESSFTVRITGIGGIRFDWTAIGEYEMD